MLGIRIAAAGAVVLLFSSATIIGAAAQSATKSTSTPGKPLQLLKIFEQPSKPKMKPHAKVLAKSSAKRAVRIAAGRKTHTHVAAAQRQVGRGVEGREMRADYTGTAFGCNSDFTAATGSGFSASSV